MGRSQHVERIVPVWLDAIKLEKGPHSHGNNARWIKPFVEGIKGETAWGGCGIQPVSAIGPRELLAYRTALAARFAPGTVNAYLLTARRLIQWAAENEFRQPVVLTGVKPVRENQERSSKAWTPAEVMAKLDKARSYNRQVYCWCACQYLGVMRPSEIQTLVLSRHGVDGYKAEQVSDGVWSIFGKTTHKSGLRRFLILPPEAMPLLDECEPCWSSHQTHWQGCNTAMDAGPHRFRHSSFQHLLDLAGPELLSTVELIGGHYGNVKVLLKHYAQPQWQALRKYGAMLAGNVPGLACPAGETAAA
jgi:integrase